MDVGKGPTSPWWLSEWTNWGAEGAIKVICVLKWKTMQLSKRPGIG